VDSHEDNDDSLVSKTRLNKFERALIEAVPRLPRKKEEGDGFMKAFCQRAQSTKYHSEHARIQNAHTW
jgi:hypothetical protein